ncbi:MAG: cell wall hydrolase [Kiloniellales bacterium]
MLICNKDGLKQRIVRTGRAAGFLLAVTLPGLLAMDTAQAQGDRASQGELREELYCLALNIYFEARNQSELGQRAVGHVVLNRVQDRRFPNTICGVVQEGGKGGKRHSCQFSWWCDGRSNVPRDARAWEESLMVASYVYWGFSKDPTYGALWYHADYVQPVWRKALQRGPEIGRHIFYLHELTADQRASRGTAGKGEALAAALEPQG